MNCGFPDAMGNFAESRCHCRPRAGVKKKYLTPALLCSKIHKADRVFAEVISKMDKIYEQTMLFDFYGELLTEHQRAVYTDAVYNDMSLGEIAEERGISRQGVHDLIKRCDKILLDYESKLHLVERFARAKETVKEIGRLTEYRMSEVDGGLTEAEIKGRLQRIGALSQELLKEL